MPAPAAVRSASARQGAGGYAPPPVAARIRRRLGGLTPTERRPALALLANYPVAGLETVAQFAARAKVSGPTILRLIAKLRIRQLPRFPAGATRRAGASPADTARESSAGVRPSPAGRFPIHLHTRHHRKYPSINRRPSARGVRGGGYLTCRSPPAHPAPGRPLHVQPRESSLPAFA